MNKSIEMKIRVWPIVALGPTSVLNSRWSFSVIVLNKIFSRLDRIQKSGGIKVRAVNTANQLSGRNKAQEGSKIENKLVIIVILGKQGKMMYLF